MHKMTALLNIIHEKCVDYFWVVDEIYLLPPSFYAFCWHATDIFNQVEKTLKKLILGDTTKSKLCILNEHTLLPDAEF